MTLKNTLKKGDWVRATHESGAVIEGQAAHNMVRFGDARLSIVMPDITDIRINVNFLGSDDH